MLLGLIIAIIFGITRGPESEFVSSVPHLKKEIKKNVTDDAREKELISLVKAYEKTIKKSEKESKKLKKAMDKASADREVNREAFLREVDNYYKARERLLASLINYRLLFQEQITEEEVAGLYDAAMITSKRERRQEVKKDGKAEKKLMKVFDDIGDIIIRHIDDSTATALVQGHLDDFEATIFEFIEEAHDLSIRRQIMVDNKNATREEMLALFESTGQLRYRASREFATLRQEIIKNTNEKEWKAINKELRTFTKS